MTYQSWSIHQEGNIPGHQTAKKGKPARPDSIPAEALKTDIETSVELLWRRTNAIGMEGSLPHQAANEGWSQLLYQIQGNSTTVHPMQAVQLSATEQDKWCSWPPASGPADQLSQGQVLHRPDCNIVHHPRTVMWMKLPSVCQLSRLWEGIWQSGLTDPLQTAETL